MKTGEDRKSHIDYGYVLSTLPEGEYGILLPGAAADFLADLEEHDCVEIVKQGGVFHVRLLEPTTVPR